MNKYQCPQCGAASSMKVSATHYHCIYCDSDFEVKADAGDLINDILKKQTANYTSTPYQTNPSANYPNYDELSRKRKTAVMTGMLAGIVMVAGVAGFVFFKAKNTTGNSLGGDRNWSAATITSYHLFNGSKGPVAWVLSEQSGFSLDSERYTMQIFDPIKNSAKKEFLFVPDVTWHDGFSSGDFIGDFYAQGDTCWQANKRDGLIARDIYSGNVLVDANQMKKNYPQFAAGITQVSSYYNNRYFEVNTADGFDFVFLPSLKKVYSKSEWDKANDERKVMHNFFTLSESSRPALYISKEKSYALDPTSMLFANEVDGYGSLAGMPDYMRADVKEFKNIPDKVFFNGTLLSANDARAVIAYKESNAQQSALHIVCYDNSGKQLWDLGGSSLKPFSDEYGANNNALQLVEGKNNIVIYMTAGNRNAIGVNVATGKISWSYERPDQTF
ncbi:MAG: hypothetical protein HY064_02895 [Bacteroidetes bacterium]|nr:hypothetical protein [Bacteroidota bacterium]